MTRSKQFLITSSSDQSIKIWGIPLSASSYGSPFKKQIFEQVISSDMFLHILEILVSIKTLSNQPRHLEECRRGARFIKTVFQQLGAKSQLIPGESGRNPLVYGRFNSVHNQVTAPTILFYGHYDVAPTNNDKKWLNNPFKLFGMNGYLYGRGANDNKGSLATNIFSVHELLKEGLLNVNVVFLIEGEGENGSVGLLEALNAHKDMFENIDLILLSNSYWLGEGVPCITYGLRGVIHATVTISSHLSDLHLEAERAASEPLIELVHVLGKLVNPSRDVLIPGFYHDVLPVTNAEEILYDPIIEWLQLCKNMAHNRLFHSCVTSSVISGSNNGNDDDDDDTSSYDYVVNSKEIKRQLMLRWRYPTLTVHDIDVSVDNPTIISHKAAALVSMRIVPNQSIEVVCNGFKQYIHTCFDSLKSVNHINVDIKNHADYWLGDPHHPYFQAAAKAIEEEWNMKPLFIREGDSIPAVSWLEKICQAPVIHIPFGQSSDQTHLPNERICLSNLHASRRIIKSLLLKIGNKLN
ncbi:Zn-dependent exopeptidase [Backusella circina FSU 941]|nr:Zn-dependent exopeptidase [Backusella circina FSU 941]